MIVHVKLTKPQAQWVDWALTGPISDWDDVEQFCWDRDCCPEEAQQAIRDRDASTLNGLVLTLDAAPDGDFIADLLNMLEDVAPDLESGFGWEAAASKCYESADVVTYQRTQAALRAGEKIRQAVGLDQS